MQLLTGSRFWAQNIVSFRFRIGSFLSEQGKCDWSRNLENEVRSQMFTLSKYPFDKLRIWPRWPVLGHRFWRKIWTDSLFYLRSLALSLLRNKSFKQVEREAVQKPKPQSSFETMDRIVTTSLTGFKLFASFDFRFSFQLVPGRARQIFVLEIDSKLLENVEDVCASAKKTAQLMQSCQAFKFDWHSRWEREETSWRFLI